jgi:hypothetical protein
MKRFTLPVIVVMFGVFSSVASAKPATGSDGVQASATKTTWTAEYNAESYYGAVKCTGKTFVNKRYPGGKDVEICESVGGTLTHMRAGKHQTAFENSEGGFVNEWESDSGSGERTTNYFYNVNKTLTKFKLVAIYPAPEA